MGSTSTRKSVIWRTSRALRVMGLALASVGLVMLTSVVSPGYAATVTWTNAVSGNWSDGTKWSTNPNPPQAGDDVVINVAGTYTVTLNVDVTIKSLSLGGTSGTQTLQTGGRALTLTNASTVNSNGVLTCNAGTVTGGGNLAVSGTFNWTAGTVSGSGSFTVNGTLILDSGSSKILSGRTIVSNNSAQLRGSGPLTLTLGAVLRNAAAGTFDVQVDGFIGVSGTPSGETFDNDGTLVKSGGMGTTTFDVNMDVSGPVMVNSGILAASRGGSWSGTLTTGSTMRFNGGTHNLSGLVLAGSGRAEVTGGTVNTAGSVTVSGTTTLLNSATFGGAGALTVNGRFEWTAGTVTGTGAFVVNGTLIFDSGSSKTLNGRTIVSTNVAEWRSAGSITLSNGAILQNAASGTFDIQQAAFMGVSGTPSTETFVNDGALTKDSVGTTTIDVNMENAGSVSVTSGALVLTRASTWSGPVTIDAVLRFAGGTHTLAGLTLAGTGRTEITAGTVNANGPVTVASSMTLAHSATFGGPGALTVAGRFEWTAGTITGSGGFVVDGTLIIDSGSSKTLNGRTIVSNNVAEWRSGGTINLSNGAVLRNAATGSFDIQNNAFMGVAGTPGSETFDNDGTLMKSSGSGTTTLDVIVESSGPVSVNSGVLAASRLSTWTGPIDVATTLRFSGGMHNLMDLAITGSGRTEIAAGTVNTVGTVTTGNALTLSNVATLAGTGALTVNGRFEWNAGTVTGSGAFVVNGAMILDSGSSKILSGRNLVSNGTAEWRSSGTVNLGNGAVLRNGPTGVFDIQGNAFMGITGTPSSETFDNDGAVKKSGAGGTTTLDVLVTNSGSVEIQSGVLAFSRAAYLQTVGVTRLNGGNMTVLAGVGMNQQGGFLTGNGTVTGSVLNTAGNMKPGVSPGRLMLTSAYTQNVGGALDTELGGRTPVAEYDQLKVNGTAALSGALNVTLVNGFVPVEGDQFLVLDGTTTGTFTVLNLPSLAPGLSWQVTYNPVVLTVVAGGPTPTPSTAATSSVTPTAPATHTPTASRTVTHTATATGTPSTPTASATCTPTSPTLPPTATGTSTVSPAPTRTSTATPATTSTPTLTASATAPQTPTLTATPTGPRTTFHIGVLVYGPAPAGSVSGRGLRPIVGQVLELYVCATPGQCLHNRGNSVQSAQTNGEGRATFEVSIAIVDQGSYVLIEAIVNGTRCRLLITPHQLAILAGRVRAGTGAAGGVEDGELSVDPLVEAAARLLESAGPNSYDAAAIEALIDAVDAANADTQFAGLTVAAANDRAETVAAAAPAVQALLQDARLCAGDCNADSAVRVNELVLGVNIALARATVADCAPLDTNASGTITVDELVTAVNRLIAGCESAARI